MAGAQRGNSRLLIALAFLSFIAMGLFVGLMGVAWPSIRLSYGIPLDAIGALFLFSMAASLIFSFSSGRLIAGVGLGVLLLIGGILASLGFLGYAAAPAWWTMILAAAIASAGTTLINTGLNTYFAIISTASLMSWLHASFGLGATISPIVMAAMLNAGYSWRWGFAFVALCFAVLSLLYLFTRRHWPLPEHKASDQSTDVPVQSSYRDSLKLAGVWLSLLLFAAFTGMEGTAGQWPYVLFTESRAIDPVVAGLWVSIFWASITMGRLFFGAIVGRTGTVPLIRACGVLIVAGSALLWWNPSNTLSFAGLILIGFAASPYFPVLASETPRLFGQENAANIIGFQITAVRLGLAIVPASVGVLARAAGLETIGLSMFAIAVAVVVLYELTLRTTARAETALPEGEGSYGKELA
ncbi:MAG: MFS transporter [Chloroflexota bacterium]|nr:MFS transporter [Chloroflexota bacterium]